MKNSMVSDIKNMSQEEINNLPKDIKKFFSSKKDDKKIKEIRIKNLKSQLSSTDYQIIKCYEYSLTGLELPYDIQTLHTEREAIREQIRELENTN